MEDDLLFERLTGVLQDFANRFMVIYSRKLQDSYASGRLDETMKWELRVRGSKYNVVLYLQDYWRYIEYGRRPGKFPPVDAIRRWVEIKPVLPRGRDGMKPPTVNQLAYLIGRKIARKGISAKHYMRDSLQELEDDFVLALEDAMQEDTEKTVRAALGGVPVLV